MKKIVHPNKINSKIYWPRKNLNPYSFLSQIIFDWLKNAQPEGNIQTLIVANITFFAMVTIRKMNDINNQKQFSKIVAKMESI